MHNILVQIRTIMFSFKNLLKYVNRKYMFFTTNTTQLILYCYTKKVYYGETYINAIVP